MVSVRVAHVRLMGGTAAILACGFKAAAAQESGIPAIELAPGTIEAPPPATDETTTRIEKQTLEHRMVQSIQDLGRRVDAGINYSRETNSINLRGLGENRVLTTIDGIRQTWMEEIGRASLR